MCYKRYRVGHAMAFAAAVLTLCVIAVNTASDPYGEWLKHIAVPAIVGMIVGLLSLAVANSGPLRWHPCKGEYLMVSDNGFSYSYIPDGLRMGQGKARDVLRHTVEMDWDKVLFAKYRCTYGRLYISGYATITDETIQHVKRGQTGVARIEVPCYFGDFERFLGLLSEHVNIDGISML